jgi:hypothetical protein
MKPTVVFAFGDPEDVSSLTPLLPFYDFGGNTGQLLIALVNLDETNNVTLIVENSQDGEHVDIIPTELMIPPGKQGTVEVSANTMRKWWRISAHTDDPAFPIVQVKWQVLWREANF